MIRLIVTVRKLLQKTNTDHNVGQFGIFFFLIQICIIRTFKQD